MKLPTAHLHRPHITPLHAGAAGMCIGINTGYYTLMSLIGIPLIPMLGLGVAILGGSLMAGQEFIDTHTATPEN